MLRPSSALRRPDDTVRFSRGLMPLSKALRQVLTGHPQSPALVRASCSGITFFLAVHIIVVLCLAHASLPDPTWIPGFYDNGDYDDAIVALLDAHAVTETPPAVAASSETTKLVSALRVSSRPSTRFSSLSERGPPSNAAQIL